MWNDREFSPANLLKYNTIEELFIAYIDKEAAAVMILQEEDRTFWPDSGNDSLFFCTNWPYAGNMQAKGYLKTWFIGQRNEQRV